MDIVFLGTNNAGREIYDWLCSRDEVTVRALVTTKQQLELIESIQPDVVVAVGYQHIVPEDILKIPDEGCINVHPGYLPHGRGFNPNVWSIIENLPAGATVHYMDDGIDTGEIIARERVDKSAADTGKSLYQRIERACVDLFKQTWPSIESSTVEAVPQTESDATYHQKSDFVDLCRIDPEQTYEAKELIDILRALSFPPFDNAYIEIDGEKQYIEIEVTPASEREQTERVGTIDSY
ncbi:methionyl-tRNA formyltransferase [Halohasta litchfieldiae]|jgi:methionyl-tRNA formyltransferase|uniref:Methionyl-tRNA formyltransferase n=1 Tax=Halohasta litchfieldiae TaxID=1073996 RepID=A0A1H6YH12_9EURY|nr:formyltransferase family protein [Halohasta litchfieldiae]SEJ36055.1 methionyl-tRNA formyltransferase [Halohasta litchfieldiae]